MSKGFDVVFVFWKDFTCFLLRKIVNSQQYCQSVLSCFGEKENKSHPSSDYYFKSVSVHYIFALLFIKVSEAEWVS